ncbi:MAG: glycosyltransferase [Muribaculaceae bacterium]|nr:glycosyltransferase [Muribaculaceae bacterium]
MKSWKILFHASGFGKVRLRAGNITVAEQDVHCMEADEKQIEFTCNFNSAGFYLDVEARDKMELSDIQIITNETEKEFTKVCIALNICTFHRQKALYHSLGVIQSSRFFQTNDSLYGKLQVYVVDNASEISIPKEEFISVYHNPNTGGSGGFTRGLVEIRKELPEAGTTHVIFMDDDVEFIPETLYRLYALLSLIKEEYRDEVIAGRMFRMDDRKVQYTAAEIWNRGNIRHLGFNADMTQLDALKEVNDNTGAEYGGWWFCCFPMSFAKNNNPLPFFLHCDDVEYGLRHGGTPIILNGIQVWHETYEYRQTPVMAYYDCRNSLVVNSKYTDKSTVDIQIKQCMSRIKEAHIEQNYILEYFLIQACWDYLKGEKWFMQKADSAIHMCLIKKEKVNRYINNIRRKRLERIIASDKNKELWGA